MALGVHPHTSAIPHPLGLQEEDVGKRKEVEREEIVKSRKSIRACDKGDQGKTEEAE